MKKSIKVFNSELDTARGRLPLHSLVVILTGKENKVVGTLINKVGVADATTAKDLIDTNKIYPFDNLYVFHYDHTISSLSIEL